MRWKSRGETYAQPNSSRAALREAKERQCNLLIVKDTGSMENSVEHIKQKKASSDSLPSLLKILSYGLSCTSSSATALVCLGIVSLAQLKLRAGCCDFRLPWGVSGE